MLFSFLLFRTHVVSSFFLLQHTTWKGKHICGADNIFSVCVCHHVTFQYCTEEDMLYVLHSTRESMEHYRNVLETSCGESCQNFSFRLLVQKTYFLTFLDIFCYALISSLLLYSLLKECRACAFFEIILNCNPHVIEWGSLASI